MVQIASRSVRASIVSACERVLARIGFERMTMADVAAEAGLARRTLYLHFGTKEALAQETIQAVVSRAKVAMERCLESGSGIEALGSMLTARILSRLQQVGAYHHSLDEILAVLYPHNAQYNIAYYEVEITLVQRAIERGVADGTLSAPAPRETAEVLIRATNGFLPSNLSPAEAVDLPVVRVKLARLVAILTAGLFPQIKERPK
jgi:AcrR family transcriptional regulator